MSLVQIGEELVQSAISSSLIAEHDLVYQGAFRLPPGPIGTSTFDSGGTGLAYNPARDSLFISGYAFQQATAEVSIPDPVISTNLNDLHTATVLQPFADATEGKKYQVDLRQISTSIVIGGQMVYNGKLIINIYIYYDTETYQTRSLFTSGLDFSVQGDVEGPYALVASNVKNLCGHQSGWLCPIPLAWQDALGGPALAGNGAIAITSRSSQGPAAFVFDPAQLTPAFFDGGTPSVALLDYPVEHPTIGYWSSTGTLFNGANQIGGMLFPDVARSILYFGRIGTTNPYPFCYGTGVSNPALHNVPRADGENQCYDPVQLGGHGTHGYPYKYIVYAYDALDLAAVKAGILQPWDVVPYATWNPTFPILNGGNIMINGACWDAVHGRIFVSEATSDSANPLLHVYTIANH